MKSFDFCMQDKTGEAAVLLNPTDTASIRPWCWSFTSRLEKRRHGTRSKFFKKSSITCLRCCIKLQSHQCTAREEKKKDTNRRSESTGQPVAKWVNRRQELQFWVSSWFCFLILLGIRMQVVKASEAISLHREVDRTTEKDFGPKSIRFADRNSLRRMESFEGEWEKKEGNQKLKRRDSQERDPMTLEKRSQEGSLSASSFESKGESGDILSEKRGSEEKRKRRKK